MTISITTKWEHSHIQSNRGRTHLVLTVSAAGNGVTASNPYLDIRLPESTRLRYIGAFPNDGFGNTAGVDLPDIEPGQSLQLVFRVKTRNLEAEAITPDIHLHWLDLESDTLTEIDQTGSSLPIHNEESPEGDPDIATIAAAARSARRDRHTNQSNQPKEKPSMRPKRHYRHYQYENTEEPRSCSEGRGHRRRARAEARGEAMAERHYRRRGHRHEAAHETGFGRRGRHAGRRTRGGWQSMREDHGHDAKSHRGPANMPRGKGSLHRTLNQVMEQMDNLERRVRRMQRQARFQAHMPDERVDVYKTHRRITRTRRTVDPDRADNRSHHRQGHHTHERGRRMGGMANRAWRDRQLES